MLDVQSTLLSETQLVCWQRVGAAFACTVVAIIPRFVPCRVNTIEPVAAKLAGLVELEISRAMENPCVELPARLPTDIDTLRVPPPGADPIRHNRDDSDIHEVASQEDRPIRDEEDCPNVPKLLPRSVQVMDPDDGILFLRFELNMPMSFEKIKVEVPTFPPTLNDNRPLPLLPNVV